MRHLSRLPRLCRNLFHKERVETELGREVESLLDLLVEEKTAAGMSPAEARRQARMEIGGTEQLKERVRTVRAGIFLDALGQDLRFATRTLGKRPLFLAVAVATLALGIGLTTAVFSVVNGVLLKPLPFPEPDRLVGVWMTAPKMGIEWLNQSQATYFALREESRVFEDVAIWKNVIVTITGLAEAEQVQGLMVTDGLLPLLGAAPLLGRTFTPEEDTPGGPPVVILGYGFWQRRLGGDRSALGRTITVDELPRRVVGVMPEGFRFLHWVPDVFFPAQFDPATAKVENFSYRAIARLRPRVSLDDARADVARVIPMAIDRYGGWTRSDADEAGLAPRLRSLRSEVVGATGAALWVVMGGVSLVLLISCANVAILLLVRAEEQQREHALRAAFGAPRTRIIQGAAIENVLLGICGGGAGLVLAAGGTALLSRFGSAQLPRLHAVSLDANVLLFALVASIATSLLFGLAPLLRQMRVDLMDAVKEGARSQGSGRKGRSLRNLLVVSQLAAALVLLVGSGLALRSLLNLAAVDPGFGHPESVLTLRLMTPGSGFFGGEEGARKHEAILRRLASLPGVTAVGASSSITMDRNDSGDRIEVEGFPARDGHSLPVRRLKWIGGAYFETMENPVLVGRPFNWSDVHARAPVAVVTEDFAAQYWSSPARALGKRLREKGGTWREIVGVVGSVLDDGAARKSVPVVYLPMAVEGFWGLDLLVWRSMGYAVRTTRSTPESLMPEIKATVRSVDAGIPVSRVQTLDKILAASTAQTSFAVVMLVIAALAALLLSIIGVYGVVSYAVSRRTREIGVRVALGARAADITGMVLREGLGLTVVGVLAGLAGALASTRLLSSLLFGITPLDAATYGLAVFVLAAVALLACCLPAWRASRLNPVMTLRME